MFRRISGNGWWILGLACVIAAAALALWASWIAVPLAVFGLGIVVPIWLGRSWREILEAAGARLPWLVRPFTPSLPEGKPDKEEEDAWLQARGSASRRNPLQGPTQASRQVRAEAPVRQAPPVHTWTLRTHGKEPSEEAALRPQNAFRLAGAPRAEEQDREQPAGREEAKEMIDLPSVLKNLERRYRDKRLPGRTPVSETDSAEAVPEVIEIEEVQRRLKGTYGEKLARRARQVPHHPPAEGLQDPAFKTSGAPADAPGSQPVRPHLPSKVAARIDDYARRSRLARNASNGSDAPASLAEREPVPSSSAPVADEAMLPETTWAKPGPPPETSRPLGRLLTPEEPGAPAPGQMDSIPVLKVSALEPTSRKTEDGFVLGRPLSSPSIPNGLPRLETLFDDRPWDTDLQKPASELAADRPLTAHGEGESVSAPRAGHPGESWMPPLSLLSPADSVVAPMSQDDLIDGGILIEEKLAEFRVKVNVQDAYAGPVITRYEIQPAMGVRGGQVVSLVKDLARALGVASIRVVETIPGKTCMGLELPNPRRQMIRLSEVLSSDLFQSHPSKLAMVLGKDIIGEPVVADLAKAPHLLVAGTTGSGKSVGVNAMILSLLYRATPDEVRFVMIDPKMLELSIYDGIPHLLAPVVTDMKLAANALTWCVGEMERRYRLMSGLRVRNLAGYNQKVREAASLGEPLVDTFSSDQDSPVLLSELPYVVVVVDELADLMMVAGKKIEELIARLAQKARAAGIHLIIATQRPSVDVITGLIKANIPTRIAFQVSSKIDSRTILDQMGAECLLGQGDMLYLPPGTGYPQRVHGAFVADDEVHAVAAYLKQFGEPDYVEGVLEGSTDAESPSAEADRFDEDTDPLYDEAVAFVISTRRASISAVQRQLRIGYNRAARLVEQMEASGLVSAMESNGNRTVLVPPRQD